MERVNVSYLRMRVKLEEKIKGAPDSYIWAALLIIFH